MRIVPKTATPILLATFFVYLPFITNPDLLLNRSNDLTEFFWPIIHYIRESIFIYHQLPLWNNLFFMGTPLVSDPQNLYWYLPNIIFLFLPINVGIITTYILHSVFGGIGMYLSTRHFKLSKFAAVTAACLFIAAPKLAGYLEAGHFGLVLSFAWIPWVLYSLLKLTNKPKFKWAVLLALTLTAIYFNHILTAAISVLISCLIGLLLFVLKPNIKVIGYAFLAAFCFLLLIGPALYVQANWLPQTTRNLLLNYPDVYPKWDTEIEFVKNTFWPVKLETEKLISLGLFSTVLALFGFLKLKTKLKYLLPLCLLAIALISLNNLSPIYDYLITQRWYILLRVSTRAWFVVSLSMIILTAIGIEFIYKKNKLYAFLVAFLVISESVLMGYHIISKKNISPQLAPESTYSYLASDRDNFRVFCTTRCLSQKQATIYGLKLADGYGTLQQKNYFEAAKQIGQYYTDRYSLSIPPFDIYLYQKLQPHSPTLNAYGIKYVISPHPLNDKNLVPTQNFGRYIVYRNSLFVNPNYLFYSPNHLKIGNDNLTPNITVSEIYNSNWRAFDEFQNELEVSETQAHTIKIETAKARVVNLKYLPYVNLFRFFAK